MCRVPWARIAARAAIAVAGWAMAACAGPSQGTKRALHAKLAAADFAGAEALLKQAKETEYRRKNAVLYNLDMGMVLHHAGKFRESDQFLDRAEKRMEELYTKSAAQMAGTLLLNDNTMDYAGEVFERALTNAFRALNYVFLGLPDEALVEARKVEVFLEDASRNRGKGLAYRDDAFVRYLDGLLYEESGKHDDARISREAAAKAYERYQKEYGIPPPAFQISRDPKKSGEVVFIHYAGVAPRKVSKTFQVAWGEVGAAMNASPPEGKDRENHERTINAINAGVLGKALTVSFPEYVQDPYNIVGSRVQAGGESVETALMEDVSAIARRELKDRIAGIRARAITRAAIKHAIANAAAAEVEKKAKNKFAKDLTRALLSATAAATEVADTRAWSAVPAQIRMARLRLPPGRHSVEVAFTDSAGRAVMTHVFQDVVVRKGRRTYLHYRTAS